MGTTRQRAEWYAGDITNLLWRKTGHSYSIYTHVHDELKELTIHDDKTNEDIITYVARTWVGICDRVIAAYKTHLRIENA